jgi:hypothetical protein
MNETLSTEHIDCWLCTGSVGLLPKTENLPNSSPQRWLELPHLGNPTCRIRTPDSRNLRREVNNRNNRSYNPHSSLDTHQPPLLRPRGFLP